MSGRRDSRPWPVPRCARACWPGAAFRAALRVLVTLRIDAIGVGVQRHLGVDDEVAAAGKEEDHVGAHRAGAFAAFGFDGERLLECCTASPSRRPALSSRSRRMNSPQSPCAFAEPRKAVDRLRASSVSCWLSVPSVPMRVSSSCDAGLRIALRLLHFFAEFVESGLAAARAGCPVLSGCLQRRFSICSRGCRRPGSGIDSQGLLGVFQQSHLFRQVLPLVVEFRLQAG